MALDTIVSLVIYLVVSFILFIIGKLIYRLFHPGLNAAAEMVEQDNFAFALSYTGYFIGLVLAIGGSIVGPSSGIVNDVIDISLYGILSILLLNISILINDKVILRKFSVRKEIIEDRNAGTGIIEAASCIGAGLIIYAAVSGEGGSMITAVGYWAIGQVVMVIVSALYNLITPYDIHEHIEKDNVAVGIGFAGAMVAFSIIIMHALSGDFYGWDMLFETVGLELLIGLIMLPLMRFLADVILLPGQKLTDEIVNQENPNMGAAVMEAFAYIASALLIFWCL